MTNRSFVQGTHYVALDSWRGIAAVMVAIFHFPANHVLSDSTFQPNLGLFVDFFFVLSGFVIASNYGERLAQGFGIGRFMLLRVGRLWPLHVTILLALIGIETARLVLGSNSSAPLFTDRMAPDKLLAAAFLIQSLGISPSAGNGAAWSISTEFWTYVIFAVVAAGFVRRYAVILACIALVSAAFLYAAPSMPEWTHVWTFMARCLFGFAVGALIYQFFWRKETHRLLASLNAWTFTVLEFVAIALMLSFLSAASLDHSSKYLGHINVWSVPVFALVVLVFAFERGHLSGRYCTRSPFSWVRSLTAFT